MWNEYCFHIYNVPKVAVFFCFFLFFFWSASIYMGRFTFCISVSYTLFIISTKAQSSEILLWGLTSLGLRILILGYIAPCMQKLAIETLCANFNMHKRMVYVPVQELS